MYIYKQDIIGHPLIFTEVLLYINTAFYDNYHH